LTFKNAVERSSDLQDGWRSGLHAIREVDRGRLDAEDTRRIKGSVDIEACLSERRSGKRQWDYAVGFRPTNLSQEVVYWIEVHPATPGEVNVVLEKLEHLLDWLRSDGSKLNAMKRAFIWISSGSTSFSQKSPQAHKLSQAKLRHVGRFFRIPASFLSG
jgi:hypothetical protein